MKFRHSTALIFISLTLISGCANSQFSTYVSRSGDKLMDGSKEIRFVSVNIPNLHYIEDNFPFEDSNPWRLPNEFEIRDALNAVKQMNGKVARIYVISVKKQSDAKDVIPHVEAPGVFNEDAFRALDKVLQVANETGVRVIIPLVDNWWWWGGPAEYAAFRGKKKDEFWTDTLLISDFKKTVSYVLNRKNSYTGTVYKDDKSVLAWETGNELECPFSWTKEMARYIKSIDQNHLLIEGIHSRDLSQEAVDDPNLDILSTHHYQNAKDAVPLILKNREMAKSKKPYFVGEFGFIPVNQVEEMLDTVINNNVTGIMIWSMRFRNRDGGFYYHTEASGYGPFKWPGFEPSGINHEQEVLGLFRRKAFKINGEEITPVPIPEKPFLLPIVDVHKISWQGSAGAVDYKIERREENQSAWSELANHVSDAAISYRPLFSDQSAEVGKKYQYRVFAQNESGVSAESNESPFIPVESKMIIDEMNDASLFFKTSGTLSYLTNQDIRKAKEDRNRLVGEDGSFVMYHVPGNIKSITVDAFLVNESAKVEMMKSDNSDQLVSFNANKKTFDNQINDYGFFVPVRYTFKEFADSDRYIKIMLNKNTQIGRIEISYLP